MASMFSFEGKNAAIVGGGSGIGAAVAIACAEQGASPLHSHHSRAVNPLRLGCGNNP